MHLFQDINTHAHRKSWKEYTDEMGADRWQNTEKKKEEGKGGAGKTTIFRQGFLLLFLVGRD
jgi:hypothetical protein